MKFRGYEERDAPAMFALDQICFAGTFRFGLDVIRKLASERSSATVLAEENGKLAGFTIVKLTGKSAYVITMDVAPEMRGRGLGRELLTRAEQVFAEAEMVLLHVYVKNETAIRFYEANGYKNMGEAKGFYGRDRDAWIYSKQLGKKG